MPKKIPTFEELKAKWVELEAKADETSDYYDPIPEWHKYLDRIGVVDGITFDYHWGDGGATDAIERLINIVNSDKKYIIIENPMYEDMGCSSYVVFER